MEDFSTAIINIALVNRHNNRLTTLLYEAFGIIRPGVVGSRWAPRSSKSVAGRVAGRSGFDSHPLPQKSVNAAQ